MVLVTGATGFVGRAVVDALARSGQRVRLLTRGPFRGTGTLVHLAGSLESAKPARLSAINVDGTRNLAMAARDAGVRLLTHVCSAAVYSDRVLPAGGVMQVSRAAVALSEQFHVAPPRRLMRARNRHVTTNGLMSRRAGWPRALRACCGLLVAILVVGCASTAPHSPRARRDQAVPVGTASQDAAPGVAIVEVRPKNTRQRIDGFGASIVSLVNPGSGDPLTPEQRHRALHALFEEVHLNLGFLGSGLLESPSDYASRQNDDGDPGHFNWQGFQSGTVESIRQSVLERPEAARFTDYALGQRINTRWASPWLAALRGHDRDHYLDEAAEQVAAGVVWWRERYGTVPRLLQLFNEPLSGNKELQGGDAWDVVDLVKRVGMRLQREGIAEPRFILPNEETVAATLAVASAVLADRRARRYVGVIGYHPYPYESPYANVSTLLATTGRGMPDEREIDARRRLRDLAHKYQLPLWMTEVSNGGMDTRSYDVFRGRANHIFDEFEYAEASAYFAMDSMLDRATPRRHVGSDADFYGAEGTIVLINQERDEVLITGIGRAIGHYARWLTPGSIKVDASVSGSRLLKAAAFVDGTKGRLVIVAINNANAPQQVRVIVADCALAGPAVGEQSSIDGYWIPLGDTPTDAHGAIMSLPPLGVVSLAVDLAGGCTPDGSSLVRH